MSRDQVHEGVLEELLAEHGRTYADQAGITLRDKPAPLFQLLVLATLSSAPISADVAATPAHELFRAGWRTPERMRDYARSARKRGLKVIIAVAGGAAHLPGMTAAMTPLPVFGVPVESKALSGMDSLLSIVQMPAGVPVGTLAIGRAGAVNAALMAASIIALEDDAVAKSLDAWRAAQTEAVADAPRDDA